MKQLRGIERLQCNPIYPLLALRSWKMPVQNKREADWQKKKRTGSRTVDQPQSRATPQRVYRAREYVYVYIYAADVCTVRCRSYLVECERAFHYKSLKLNGHENSVLIYLYWKLRFNAFFFLVE